MEILYNFALQAFFFLQKERRKIDKVRKTIRFFHIQNNLHRLILLLLPSFFSLNGKSWNELHEKLVAENENEPDRTGFLKQSKNTQQV